MLQTARLELTPFSAEFLRASLSGDREQAASMLGAHLPENWPTCPETFQMRLAQLEADPTLQPWLLRGIILRATRELAGHIGFHTGPNPGCLHELAPGGIEMGYTVLEPFRRRGLAMEAAEALMRWSQHAHGITRFVVSIRPDNAPSLALAAKLGFNRIGEQFDDVDGLEYIFRLDLPSPH